MAEAGETSRLEQLRKEVAKSRALKSQGVKFQVLDSINTGEKTVQAVKDGKVLGKLDLYKPTDRTNFKGAREVKMITVEPEVRRQGLATSLFNEARKLGLNPVHSSNLSQEGGKFVAQKGGPQIPAALDKNRVLENLDTKRVTREAGRERAMAIARLRAQPDPNIDISTPQARRRVDISSQAGRARFNLPFTGPVGGALGVLGFLPFLHQVGLASQGKYVPGLTPHPYSDRG